LSQLQL